MARSTAPRPILTLRGSPGTLHPHRMPWSRSRTTLAKIRSRRQRNTIRTKYIQRTGLANLEERILSWLDSPISPTKLKACHDFALSVLHSLILIVQGRRSSLLERLRVIKIYTTKASCTRLVIITIIRSAAR